MASWGLCGVMASASPLAGCLGAGDDTVATVVASTDAGDAHAGDATHAGDGTTTDGPAGEGGDGASGPDATQQDSGDGATAAPPPIATLSTSSVPFGSVGCGSMPTTMPLSITNGGGSPLHVSASVVGTAFTISPTSLTVAPSASGTINVTVNVAATATAGTPVSGSLAIFTDDPTNSNITVLLSATPSGATLTGTAQYPFVSSEVGAPAPALPLQIVNNGNASATFTIGTPSDPTVTLSGLPAGGTVTLAPQATFSSGLATFLPTSTNAVTATSAITLTGPVCGSSLKSLTFKGQGTTGVLAGWPNGNTLDFGPVSCGGAAPAPQKITLFNSSPTTDAHITTVYRGGIGKFTTDAMVGQRIPAGGSLDIHFTAPSGAVLPGSLTKVTATVTIETDADSSAQGTTVTLTEEPQGAVLAFGTATTAGCTTSANFGNFGSAGILLQTGPSQNFCVVNTGNGPAQVNLVATEQGSTPDAGVDGGVLSPYSLLVPSFSIPASTASAPSAEQESITFQPLHAGPTVGSLAVSTDPSTALCAPLPSAITLSGSAIGGGPVVTPTTLSFPATCGRAAPDSQTFVVFNSSTAVNMNWTLAGPVGSGSGQYTITANPAPGLLAPGASSTITVTALAIPSPAVDPSPASLAAQLIVTTDVPLDGPHVVALNEEPLGDQLFVTVPDEVGNILRFGQVPITTTLGRTFTFTNNANPGSPPASVSVSVSGAGAAAYSPPSQTAAPAAGASVSVPLAFNAATAGSDPGTITFATSDALCTALPAPIALQGTGTAGAVSLSAPTLYFGTNPTASDPTLRGLVNCGSPGTPQTLTIANVGTQMFNVTGVTLGKAPSPFTLSGPATTMPTVAISGSTAVTITPSPIPTMGLDPNDPSAFSDVLSITTDIPGDTAHTVQLVMQPLGAVISGTTPPAAWSFGTVGEGSIGTFQGTMVQNTGNAPATVTLQAVSPLSLPNVFGLQGNPVTVAPNSVSSLVGQFTPNLANGSWSGQAELVVTAAAFCAPLPTAWMSPQIALSGASSSTPVVTIAGNLVFPTSDCGGAPAGGQSVTLTNSTNQAYGYTLKFVSGTYYTFADGGSGMLPAAGSATIVVNPKAVTPGPGVLPGSAPYADDLIVTLATSPATSFTVPISWTLNGAVLSLVQGAGPFGPPGGNFYVADSTSGFPMSLSNTGTAAATVDFAIQPSGAFSLLPTPPVHVLPGIPAFPELVSGGSAPMCPMLSAGTATFAYAGPVCQPLPFSSVTVDSCSGTFTPQNVSPADAGAEAGPDATSPDATTPDGSSTEASNPDASDGGSTPTACTSTPCAASGPNSVQCTGNLGMNAPAGVCTPTEALFVNRDISKGHLSGGQLANSSCYVCLLNKACIDDDVGPDMGNECGDLTGGPALDGEPATGACVDTLTCILATACDTANPPAFCFCGAGGAGSACLTAGAADGPCLQQEINGLLDTPGNVIGGSCSNVYPAPLSCTEGNATNSNKAYKNPAIPSGMANNIVGCAFTNCEAACTP